MALLIAQVIVSFTIGFATRYLYELHRNRKADRAAYGWLDPANWSDEVLNHPAMVNADWWVEPPREGEA